MRSLLCLALLLSLLSGCRCTRLFGAGDDADYTRCPQVDPPSERELRTKNLMLSVSDRLVEVEPATRDAELRIAAFTGPVGGVFARTDVAQLSAARADLMLFLGGLGDEVDSATANLATLAGLHVPTLFLPGGADRLSVVDEAFASLDAEARKLVIQAAGLRELRIGSDRFLMLSGSPLGRYALDAQACGFAVGDVEALRDTAGEGKKGARLWLLSWAAPSGFGVSHALGADVGNPELYAFGQALGVRGGIFAWPESQAGSVAEDEKRGGIAAVVPRLGRMGSTRADGGRLPSQLMLLVVGPRGLLRAP